MKLTIAYSDDWEGLYKDGELMYQGHEVDRHELLAAIGRPDIVLDYFSVEGDWPQEYGEFPETLDEVKQREGK